MPAAAVNKHSNVGMCEDHIDGAPERFHRTHVNAVAVAKAMK